MGIASGCDAMGGVSIGPLEGLGGTVVEMDVPEDLAVEVFHGAEDPPGQHVPLNLAKPELDLVEPGGVGGCVMHRDMAMIRQEVFDQLRLMSREVVGDDMDLLSGRLVGDDLGQERDE